MTLYITLIFSAICVGMAISVKAFGTEGSQVHLQDIYSPYEEVDGIGVLLYQDGRILRCSPKDGNLVQSGPPNIKAYYEFIPTFFAALAQTLGGKPALHMQDVLGEEGLQGRERKPMVP